ncbi:MAG: deoxynucleoside kinase [Chlorobi bacterium]|nr:deoxynucleoside kinase [Chlorobiota bacterium]
MFEEKEFIVIEGNIGAGKTTLARMVADDFNARLILETFEDNPFLPKFYHDRERYAFPVELSFLAARYKQLKDEIQDKDLFHSLTIADYHFLKSLIFAKETLSGDEFRLYRQLFDIIYEMVPVPDLYVYIHRPVDTLLKFIAKRGRDYEREIDAEYLKGLQDGYFRFFKEHPDMKILIINVEDLDFENNKQVYRSLLDLIAEEYPKGITYRNMIGNKQ